jgi:hypothetical protein
VTHSLHAARLLYEIRVLRGALEYRIDLLVEAGGLKIMLLYKLSELSFQVRNIPMINCDQNPIPNHHGLNKGLKICGYQYQANCADDETNVRAGLM